MGQVPLRVLDRMTQDDVVPVSTFVPKAQAAAFQR